MKELKILSFCCIFALLQMAFADEVTVTLQEGLNGYSGCEDAYIADWSSTNSGNATELYAEWEQCSG